MKKGVSPNTGKADNTEMIRTMTIDDYEEVYALWKKIRGFGIRSIDDSRDGVDRYMTDDAAVFITCVWMKHTGVMVLGVRWWFMR